MSKAMESIQHLIEEAKLRAVWWTLCIFAVSYFLTHSSKSMLMNIPIAILLISGLRILLNEVEFQWKVRNNRTASYLSHLENKQLSVNDSRLTTPPPPKKWRKIDSPLVEAAIEDFVNKLLHDFVTDFWYSGITPDREAPELMHAIIMDFLGEVSARIKESNLVDLLTRDVVNLIGEHLDLFRRNQDTIGADVMVTLSSEERDERLRHHLLASKELHPALISPDSEYKVLQRLMSGVLAVVLRPREAQCPLVRCITRELLTCLVVQPLMNFASPSYINELIEYIVLAYNNEESRESSSDNPEHQVSSELGQSNESNLRKIPSLNNQETSLSLARLDHDKVPYETGSSGDSLSSMTEGEPTHIRHGEWAKPFEDATQRRTDVPMPETLENVLTIGINNKNKIQKKAALGVQDYLSGPYELESYSTGLNIDASVHEVDNAAVISHENGNELSSVTPAFTVQSNLEDMYTSEGSTPIIDEFYNADGKKLNVHNLMSKMDIELRCEGLHASKLRCQVNGAYFQKLGSKSFAVYLIAVTDADGTTWFVKRRYRNFVRLHRHLKDIPNYTLHLPPKRMFSSSTEDVVHQRCIQLDKYLQDLLSIANVAEQHEVWDFLCASSNNYSFEESSSVMKPLTVNMDDAVDDILCQSKGVSDGLRSKVAGSPSSSVEQEAASQSRGWISDHESTSKGLPQKVVKHDTDDMNFHSDERRSLWLKSTSNSDRYIESNLATTYIHQDSLTGVPPEWMSPKLSVPVLDLVDNVFQLKQRGWLRRQVLWISKQILQFVMEDAIDDWLLRKIRRLCRDDVVAQGIRAVQDILWPEGTFFRKLGAQRNTLKDTQKSPQATKQPGGMSTTQSRSFERQLEAARRASYVKKLLFDGAPTTLVSLIGQKQYRQCTGDLYYFLQCCFSGIKSCCFNDLQSTVCLKQLSYGILELVLLSIFPELRELVLDIHEQSRYQPV
ncbi:hypothetical protein SASPL_157145 [Salvia splendens]|uniref:Sorting nexin-13 n=1 Tax=Salvia splendens TaxID=180675 RepID=A0A8X8VVG6_SALSN|nr:hypothetical protein SASPL_157145 [Salvia splendens]